MPDQIDLTAPPLNDIDDLFLAKGYKLSPDARSRPIDYIDPAPKAFVTQIPLIEYFERVKRYHADPWQVDFCNRLQTACEMRHVKRTWQEFHAEGQLGKTTILSQTFPAWILAHDPLFRYALAMYNVSRSQTHSQVIIQIMQSQIHKDLFPNKKGHLPDSVSKAGWMTNARLEVENGATDGQLSLNPVGLQSGLTGSGFDWLTIDDPYKEVKEAFSDVVRENLGNFWEYTVTSRISPYSCIAAMFHRYSPDDFGGYLLNTGEFDYVRYATVADGSYIHDETGQKFDDPLDRKEGEYISPRRPPEYYTQARKNNRVWLSMFQGRPSSEEGDFFNIGKIAVLNTEETEKRKQECSVLVRAWDLAATEEGGDFSVGGLWGMSPDGRATLFDVVREQVESAGRDELQLRTAKKDGFDVVIAVPQDPGAAGLTALFHVQQLLKGHQVVPRPTSGSKADRARSLASAINSGNVDFASDAEYGDSKKWIKAAKQELRDFPLSDHDDIVDMSADGYNECFERISKGLVVKNFNPLRNLTTWKDFVFGDKIPAHWTVYAGVKITPEASRPNSAVIVARAAQNSNLIDTLFVVAEYKEYTSDFYQLFEWLNTNLKKYCDIKTNTRVWLDRDSEIHQKTIRQKIGRSVQIFREDNVAGLTELNWYLKPRENGSSGLLCLLEDASQLAVATDFKGFHSVRQEAATWGYGTNGEPTQVGAVLDCVRMVTYQFRTSAARLTKEERLIANLSDGLKPENLVNLSGQQKEKAHYLLVQEYAKLERKEKESEGRRSKTPYASMEWK